MAEIWPEDRVERLKALLAEGLNAAQIAARIGGSRCAVIGKKYRLGLCKRRSRKAVSKSPTPLGGAASAGIAKLLTLIELTEFTCKWPIGHPHHADFGFCGAAKGAGPYCPEHMGLAYQAAPRRIAAARELRMHLEAV